MLRILHVIGKMDRAGAETMLMNLYRNIDREKIQFDFMVFTNEEGDYDQEIKDLGGIIYHMPAFKGINYLSLYRKFGKFFKEHPYGIVHAHIGSLAPAYLKCAKRYGSYAIAHSHATNSNKLGERIVFSMFASGVRNIADYFFACSEEAGIDRFGEKIVESTNFAIIKNAIDSEKFIYSEERHQILKKKFGVENNLVIGHVGRFVASKNHKFIVEIAEEYLKTRKDVKFIFVGRGEEEENIKALIAKKNLEDYFIFAGVRNDIPDLMNTFDAFIFPSFYEGLGNVGIEAQAAGLPCFFSDTIPDEAVITDNVWKYPLSWGAAVWKEHMDQVLENYQRRNVQSEVIKSGFDVRQSAKELEQFYLSKSN